MLVLFQHWEQLCETVELFVVKQLVELFVVIMTAGSTQFMLVLFQHWVQLCKTLELFVVIKTAGSTQFMLVLFQHCCAKQICLS